MTDLATAKVGDKVRFKHMKGAFTVQARNERYLVCTRPFSLKKTVLYTIVDLEKGIRGRDNMVFCPGYETRDACEERLKELAAGEMEVSHRNWVSL